MMPCQIISWNQGQILAALNPRHGAIEVVPLLVWLSAREEGGEGEMQDWGLTERNVVESPYAV